MDGINIKATAHVVLKKYDEHGKLIGKEEREVPLTKEEVEAIWHSQKPE